MPDRLPQQGGAVAASDQDGLPLPRRYWAMLAIALSLVLAVLDGAIANVALPTIAVDLHASPSASIWVVNAYQLAITVSLLPLASLGEIVGYQRVYRAGLLLFVLASFACAMSGSLLTLTLARVLQGFGASGIMAVNTALIRFIYPQSMLGRGIGYNAMVVAISSAVGPTVAAGILSIASWPWLFAINVPIGLLAFAVALPSLPDCPRAQRRFDGRSALASAATFGLLIAAIDAAGHALGLLLVLPMFACALVSGVVLVRRQLTQKAPLLPVDLLRIPMFSLSIGTSICSFAAQMLAYVALPFFLQDTLGRSEVQTGLLLTAWPLATAVAASQAGRLSDRLSPGALGGAGLLVLAAGLAAIVALPARPSDLALVLPFAACGLGFGLFQTPNNRAIVSSAPRDRSGGASGMLSTARLLGQTTGAALVAMIFALSPAHGTRLAVATAAAVSLAAAMVSVLRMTPIAAAASRRP